jgi:SAM-dependent MidA family methyltransferase
VPAPPLPATAPPPDPEALAVSARLRAKIAAEIHAAGDWIDFARYMHLALYAPGLGYYSAGSCKIGAAGDFTTAPEVSPLFGRCLARQVADLLNQGVDDIIELGAGRGTLAATLLGELESLQQLPARYRILEVSADLRARQQQLISERAPRLAARVEWLQTLPESCAAVVIGNEVIDALPVRRLRREQGRWLELGVTLSDDRLAWATRATPATALPDLPADLPDDYETEISPAASALLGELGRRLQRGAVILFDYGFPAREYYHPQRNRGTLMCHYRHTAHGDPFLWPGLQDITAHVDFSALARADHGLDLLGYTSQAQFLINCGITGLLAEVPAADAARYAPLAAAAQTLLSPAEMGELFKVIAFGRAVLPPLRGFISGDRAHRL